MQCLLIEDDADTARYISKGLKEAGFGVVWCRNGADGVHLATSERWDVVILDRMLPGDVEGLSIIQAMRTLGKTTPVLVLSALASLDERVRGLRGGGDDYLTKPFAFSELLARVHALLRRSGMKEDISELQKQFSEEFPGVSFNFSQYIQDNVEEQLSGVKGANSIKIIGPDLATIEGIANQVLAIVQQVRGVADLDIFRVLGQPNLNIRVDREKAARYGLNAGDINSVIQAALGGTEATKVLEGERQFSLLVRLAPEYRDSLDKVRAIKVGIPGSGGPNAYIPLSEIANISLDTGASFIYRERNERYIPIKFSVRGRDLEGAIADAQARIARQVKLPPGYRIEWAGEFESLQKAKKRLEVIVPLSLGLIMVLLYSLFGSVRDSLLALAGIPFAVAGGVLALFVTGLDFSISAAIGFVSLLGISVMDGILMLTYYNEVMQHGSRSSLDGMFHAASQRMRPMLMTALSACIGLVPAAISTGIGSQVQRPLATVVVGGLLIGPLMLLVVVPPLRAVFLPREERRAA